ncbi:MAG: hypothetical protein RL458_1330 [Pseudomonadota bacterium]
MSYPLTTTLNRIWACRPCDEGKRRALRAAGKNAPDDKPITYQQIIDAVGLKDALWCCKAEPRYNREWQLFAVWCARQVQHLMIDERSINALDVAERHANGEATYEELAAAGSAAWDAAWAAAGSAAWSAAWSAARAARDAAWAAAGSAARAAARAARDAAWAAAGSAAGSAAWAARDAAMAAQRNAFIQLVTTGELPEIMPQEVAK